MRRLRHCHQRGLGRYMYRQLGLGSHVYPDLFGRVHLVRDEQLYRGRTLACCMSSKLPDTDYCQWRFGRLRYQSVAGGHVHTQL